MPTSRIEIRGGPELARATERLTEKIGKTAQERFDREAEHRALIVRGLVPYESGELAGSVISEGATLGMGSDSVPYAGWIEFGGAREGGRNTTAERPYLPGGRYFWPTVTDAGPTLEQAANDAAANEIRGMQWPSP